MGATPLDDLRADIAAGQVVLVVGAGVSVAATGNAPAASWGGLLEDGVAYCERLLGPSLPDGWAERRRAQLASGDTEELISAAEDITRRLGGPGGGEYGRWLAQSIGRLEATRPRCWRRSPPSAPPWRPPTTTGCWRGDRARPGHLARRRPGPAGPARRAPGRPAPARPLGGSRLGGAGHPLL
jgi:hypothetical protein